MTRPVGRGRAPWRDYPLLLWLGAAAVVALIHRWLPDANWLLLHLVMLGAVTHSILVWSFHFAQTLLRAPADPAQVVALNRRLILLGSGTLAVLIGVPTLLWWLVLGGGLLISLAVGWHAVALWRMLRNALPSRFRITIRYYLWAAVALLVGISFGVTLAWQWEDPWQGRLMVAHALTNVLGWVGLTLTGTLLTLWPTMLRTRMDPAAEQWTRRALPPLLGGVLVADAGALSGFAWLAVAGLAGYLAGLVIWALGMWRPARNRPPREFAPASVAAGMLWLVAGLVWAGVLLATAPDWATVRADFGWAAVSFAAAGVQVLSGALSYLLPSVLGGGPSVVRAGQAWFNKLGGFRLVCLNGGLVLLVLPTPSWVKVTGSLLALLAAVAFLPLLVRGVRASVAARKALQTGPGNPASSPATSGSDPTPSQPTFTSGQFIAALTALVTAVVLGVAVDPAAAGFSGDTAAAVTPTGRVVEVSIDIQGMRYVPSSVTIEAGDRLVVELTNSGETTHDLVIGTARTDRIGPGEKTVLDAGVIGAGVQGFCSVAGHRQMGMVFDVIVNGSATAASASAPPTHAADHATADPSVAPTLAADQLVDPVLGPLSGEKVHRLTLTVQEVALQVAPGVWQRRWTFNGASVGPTLHGRVGDVFEITLVNDGSIGHSIDFHAGALAPDRPMRTIEPGERLTYRFTAAKAGIWMYHCSTMPMSAHIAAGMTGAVVIEPDDLAPVDRSYVLVQSEVYLSTSAGSPETATEVDAEGVGTRLPDHVVFNGVANGYDQARLSAKVGERVRFWVLDAGPNRSSSFHIVGAQFDTVYSEGAYSLRRGRDAFGGSGGSQALGLQPAQGGFVETVFPEAGNYPLVSHVMSDAERGAHGFVSVTKR